ncbi:MAG: amylo-alpha-1,6-glucosidase [Candidatus Eiseniibacteriota bacterium]
MGEIIHVNDRFYILATSARVDERTRVLKQGETFGVFDRNGDVQPVGLGEQGLYHEGTRYLSRLELLVEGLRPLLLSSTIKEDNSLLLVDFTNPAAPSQDGGFVNRGAVHFFRSKFLWNGAAYERLRITNYALQAVDISFSLAFGADFADVFEVRGTRRVQRGRLRDPLVESDRIVLGYEGVDGRVRSVRLEFEPAPADLSGEAARFDLHLERNEEKTVYLTVRCVSGTGIVTEARDARLDRDGQGGRESMDATNVTHATYETATQKALDAAQTNRADECRIFTSNEQFNDWVNRAISDLHMMVTETPGGPYPYAGVPWFCTPFGRDGAVTALQMLWVNPALARGVLTFLASTQATETVPEDDAEPGKILHEARHGEMAALREIPFGRYYGSVDSTPLFVMLASAYFERTGDRALIDELWPNIRAAIRWIIACGDRDGDDFIEYAKQSPRGLVNQGWKDSFDSVSHADGTLPGGSVAVCEVQGYAYAAYLGAAGLARVLGEDDWAAELEARAGRLRSRFDDAFWCEDLATYALALDGQKKPCRVRASNAGHCLYTGIASPERAGRLVASLMGEEMFSGWGVRTLGTREKRFNPMSYHNGSVWPHDNAMLASGFARYGYRHDALRILTGLFDATLFVDLHRLPELFCGFPRRMGEGPTLYPVACSPQAWASGAVFMLLEACLGLSIDARQERVTFQHPFLPPSLREVEILGLKVGDARIDLLLRRHTEDVGINVLRREGQVEVVNYK